MRGRISTMVALGVALFLFGCGTARLTIDYDGLDQETAEELVGGKADFAAYYSLNGFFRITRPSVEDELGCLDLDEPAFTAEVDRISKLPWGRTPSAVVIYFGFLEHGFPPSMWRLVKGILQGRGFRPVLLIYAGSLGPSIGVGYPYRRTESIEPQ